MPLNNHQRRQLKGMAHPLKPFIIVGQKGLTQGVLDEIDVALDTHELIKVRINAGDRTQRRDMIETILRNSGSEEVQSIGHVVVIYLRHPKKPKIRLVKS
ncbi:MAG: ribosome assembly RNA-binding protein YhbY [Gammaproteobacteria bacterium]|nr:ribosome assembly RNA-binding protein YhbY [Gammaproteobacteria bacterium]